MRSILNSDFDRNIGNYQMALKELMVLIIGFPRDQVEQVHLQYVIEKYSNGNGKTMGAVKCYSSYQTII